MKHLLLILAFATAQLLTGSAGAVYLCLDGDGSYCCVDAGPASCTCCQDDDHNHPNRPNACSQQASAPCGGHLHQPPSPIDMGPQLIAAPCDCTHVLIAQPSTPARHRLSGTADVDPNPHPHLPVATATALSSKETGSGALCRHRPPPLIPPATTLLSSVVLRC